VSQQNPNAAGEKESEEYRLRAGITTGRIDTDDLGSVTIEDGECVVEDFVRAVAFVNRYTVLDWADGTPDPPAVAVVDEDDTLADGDAGGTADHADHADATDNDDVADDGPVAIGENDAADEPTTTIAGEEYTAGDLDAMDYSELRVLASNADHDEIHGRSARVDIVAALSPRSSSSSAPTEGVPDPATEDNTETTSEDDTELTTEDEIEPEPEPENESEDER
jgi:hypothetical protein